MRTPREIYAQYTIMPNLQLHQLRVAAVGKLICDNFKEPVNTNDVVLACLFHDMGNIVKFDLRKLPHFLEPEGLEYWQKVKKDFVRTYGPRQHTVTAAIASAIGLSPRIISMLDASGFSHLADIAKGDVPELKILQYADLRVAPDGIVSMAERFEDFRRRYGSKDGGSNADAVRAGKEIEQEIFAHETIRPENITDTVAAPLVEELWEYPVE